MVSHEKIRELRNNAAASEHNKAYWSKDNDKKLREMYAEGYGISEMAIEMGRTENSIAKRIKDLKLDAKRYRIKEKRQKVSDCLCSACERYRSNLCSRAVGKAEFDTKMLREERLEKK